jgi:predicted amidohydrolase YtcJ
MSLPPIGLQPAILCRHGKTGLCLLALTSASLLAACFTSAPPPADLILVNGNFITVDADDNIAQAIAVKDGKIVAVGSNQEIERFVDTLTQRIDLNGLTATPGLLDAHAHFAAGGVERLYMLDLSYPNVTSVTGVIEQVTAQLEQSDSGEWIQGRGWDEGKFAELRYIYASDLDSITPDNPVWLTHTMGHYGVANSVALQMAAPSIATLTGTQPAYSRNPLSDW